MILQQHTARATRAITTGLLGVALLSFNGFSPTDTANVTNSALSIRNGVLFKYRAPFTGNLVETFADGAIKRVAKYRQGRLNGTTIGYFSSGRREYTRTYTRGRESGEHRGWYIDGSPRFEFHYADGVAEGVQREWFPSGQLYTLFHYVHGHEQGAEQLFNEDGTLRANYVIQNGRRYGLPGATGCQGKPDTLTNATP